MREIKFRVFAHERDDEGCVGFLENDVFSHSYYDGGWRSLQYFIRFPAFTVQQYTGLKDKKGKEIYEGDIFKGGDYKWDAVRFEGGQFQVNLMGARVFTLQELCCDIDYELPEVIGNIFENPELLE